MRLDRGPMRAALPVPQPEGGIQAGRPRGVVLAIVAAVALSLFGAAGSVAAEELPAPGQPQPVLVVADCTTTLSIVDLVPGRSYDIAVTDSAGTKLVAMSGLVATSDVLDSFVTLAAGAHTFSVVDSTAPEFAATRDVEVAPCDAGDAQAAATAPTLDAVLLKCDLLGASDVRVTATGLSDGTYATGVTANGSPVTGVNDRTVTAASSALVFEDLPNGATYLVWLRAPSGSTVATASIDLPICDLPTLEEPAPDAGGVDPSSPALTLAPTGISPATLMLAGLGVVHGGAVIAGLTVLRRRR